MNKRVRRLLARQHRDGSNQWSNSSLSKALKKLANRRVRHTAEIYNGGSYKAITEVAFVKSTW